VFAKTSSAKRQELFFLVKHRKKIRHINFRQKKCLACDDFSERKMKKKTKLCVVFAKKTRHIKKVTQVLCFIFPVN